MLESLDLSRFSREDISDIKSFFESYTDNAMKSGKLYSALKSAAPSSLPPSYL